MVRGRAAKGDDNEVLGGFAACLEERPGKKTDAVVRWQTTVTASRNGKAAVAATVEATINPNQHKVRGGV